MNNLIPKFWCSSNNFHGTAVIGLCCQWLGWSFGITINLTDLRRKK